MMLKCRDIALQADSYLERQLTLRQRMAVALHLLMCGRCRAFLRHMKLALAQYRSLTPGSATDAEVNDVMEAIGKDQHRH